MSRHIVHLGVLLALLTTAGRARAQGPTIDSGPTSPGGVGSLLGSSPGANDSLLGSSIGARAGRPARAGCSGAGRALDLAGAGLGLHAGSGPGDAAPPQRGLAGRRNCPFPTCRSTARWRFPPGRRTTGPPDGLTLDQAIERLVRENLDLRAKFFEIPQAQADILTASLRANPIFYADAQLVPYGEYSTRPARRPDPVRRQHLLPARPLPQAAGAHRRRHPGQAGPRGPVSGRRPLRIDNLYTAYVDVLRPAADGPLRRGGRRGARRGRSSRPSSSLQGREPHPGRRQPGPASSSGGRDRPARRREAATAGPSGPWACS